MFIYATLFFCRILVEYVSRCHLTEKSLQSSFSIKRRVYAVDRLKKLVNSLPYIFFGEFFRKDENEADLKEN